MLDRIEVPLCNITGVTQLGDHIFVLCGWYQSRQIVIPSIRVYEHRPPFNLLWLIPIEELDDTPTDIVSSEKSNCLYVSDKMWIWKIELERYQVIRWLSSANHDHMMMSVTLEDQLITISKKNSSYQMEIYCPDGVRDKLVPLQTPDNREPIQAIPTRNEQFFIVYAHAMIDDCSLGLQWIESTSERIDKKAEELPAPQLNLVNSRGVLSQAVECSRDLTVEEVCSRIYYPSQPMIQSKDKRCLEYPRRVFTNGRDDLLFVFGFVNGEHRLISLDINSLKCKKVILTTEVNCRELLKVWYADTHKQLIVGCDGNVHVYTRETEE